MRNKADTFYQLWQSMINLVDIQDHAMDNKMG